MAEEVEVRLRELQEELSDLKALIDHRGWKRLDEYAEGQVKNRMPSILKRTDNLLEITGEQFDKGEASGIELFRRIPYVVIEELEESISEIEEELEYDREERNRPDGTDDGDGTDFEPPV